MTFDDAHKLIKKGDILALRCELDSGMSPDLSNQFSWTLLMLAAIEGNTKIGELLVSRGANVNKTNNFGLLKAFFNSRNRSKNSPILSKAAMHKNSDSSYA